MLMETEAEQRIDLGPIYRQAHLGGFFVSILMPTIGKRRPSCHALGVRRTGRRGPEQQMEPIRAAWATPGIHRHLVDANCIIIKWRQKFDRPTPVTLIEQDVRKTAYWVAVCLNQPAYQQYLLRRFRKQAAILASRPNVGFLQNLRLPLPPDEAEQLSGLVWALAG